MSIFYFIPEILYGVCPRPVPHLVICEGDTLHDVELPDPGEDAAAGATRQFPGAEDEKHRHDGEPGHDVRGQSGRDSSKFIANVEWITSRSIFVLVTLHSDILAMSHLRIINCGFFLSNMNITTVNNDDINFSWKI